ncbi:hypothetical protein [Nocardia xishanensis]
MNADFRALEAAVACQALAICYEPRENDACGADNPDSLLRMRAIPELENCESRWRGGTSGGFNGGKDVDLMRIGAFEQVRFGSITAGGRVERLTAARIVAVV